MKKVVCKSNAQILLHFLFPYSHNVKAIWYARNQFVYICTNILIIDNENTDRILILFTFGKNDNNSRNSAIDT